MKGGWTYSHTDRCSTGLMVCNACGKKIEACEYRYRMCSKIDGYQNQHRKCSEAAAEWAALDKSKALAIEKRAEFEVDCKQFCNKWGLDYDIVIDA